MKMRRWRRFTISEYLIVFALVCSMPAMVALAFTGLSAVNEERARVQEQAVLTAQNFSQATDAEIKKLVGVLETLATSPALMSGDLRRFRDQAVSVADRNRAGIALRELNGQHVVSTLLPFGFEPMPVTRDQVLLDADKAALEKGAWVLSGVYKGATDGRRFISIVLPVFRDGRPAFLLTLALTSDRLEEQLRLSGLADADWLSAIVGQDGRVVARTRESARYVGQKASSDLLAAISHASSGTMLSRTLDGQDVWTVFRKGEGELTTVVSVSKAVLDAPVKRLVLMVLALGLAILGFSMAGAIAFGRLLQRELKRLAENARAMENGDALHPFAGRIVEIETAQSALIRAAEQVRGLVKELDHRVKNTLSIIQSISSRTVRDPGDRDKIIRRLSALSYAQEALSSGEGKGIDLSSLLRAACSAAAADVRLSGPSVQLTARAATSVSQAVQELLHNAQVHGVLSAPSGAVELRWTVGEGRVRFDWRERGAIVGCNEAEGFGLKLVRLSIERQLDGSLTISRAPTGWTIQWSFPLSSLLGDAASVAMPPEDALVETS
ncbi:sensor histidine kinase [Alsobacter sp. R-9]